MVYGYARVSTRGQERDGNGLDAQVSALVDAGCAEIVSEAFTGTKTDRPEFKRLIERLEDGDTLVVAKLDRIARTSIGGCEVVRSLLDRGVSVRVLNMGTLDNTPVGKMMVAVMFAMAEFERDMIVQRTQEGKAIARLREGYHEGRPRIEVDEVEFKRHLSLVRGRQEKLSDALSALGIGRTKWYELARGMAQLERCTEVVNPYFKSLEGGEKLGCGLTPAKRPHWKPQKPAEMLKFMPRA